MRHSPFPDTTDRMIRPSNTITRGHAMHPKDDTTKTSPEPATQDPPAEDQAKRRYRLTAPHTNDAGVVWPVGYLIDATPAELKRRGIQAEVVGDG